MTQVLDHTRQSDTITREERRALQRGTLQGLVAFDAVIIAAFLLDGTEAWTSGRYVWYAVAFVVLNAGLLYALWREGQGSSEAP